MPLSSQLRDVAHGLFPAVLAEEGLAQPWRSSPSRCPGLCRARCRSGRFPGEVESAAYFAALESLRLTEHDVTVDAVAEQAGYSW